MTQEEFLSTIRYICEKSKVGNSSKINAILNTLEKYENNRVPIIKIVADYFNLNPDFLKLKSRYGTLAQPRQIACYFYRNYTKMSLEQIGLEFSTKFHIFKHDSVLYGIREVNKHYEIEKDFRAMIDEIQNKVEEFYTRNSQLRL